MTDEAENQLSEDEPRRLKGRVIALAVIYVMTFVSGFLQDTPFNFFNWIFFLLLSFIGLGLVRVTANSGATGMTKGFLFLTGMSSVALGLFFVGYEWSRLRGLGDLETSLEAFLYSLTLLFLIAVIGSLVTLRRRRAFNPSES